MAGVGSQLSLFEEHRSEKTGRTHRLESPAGSVRRCEKPTGCATVSGHRYQWQQQHYQRRQSLVLFAHLRAMAERHGSFRGLFACTWNEAWHVSDTSVSFNHCFDVICLAKTTHSYTDIGPQTCGRCVGSGAGKSGHVALDMAQFAKWGADFIEVSTAPAIL